jgi:hypothetical protein
LSAILATLSDPFPVTDPASNRDFWESWREGLTMKATLSANLPPLLLLLVMDNLTGHKSPDWLIWCFQQGVLPIYTTPWQQLVEHGCIHSADPQAARFRG